MFVLIGAVCIMAKTALPMECGHPTIWGKAFHTEAQCAERKKEIEDAIKPTSVPLDGHFECSEESEIQ